jgi:cytochrome c553
LLPRQLDRGLHPAIIMGIQVKLIATPLRARLLVAATLLACSTMAFSADQKASDTSAAPATPAFSPKNTFRNICGFCHEDYGRHAGKGPQLMNDTNSDEYLFNRIKNGKPGRMAAFGGAFTDDQIRELVVFIRSLRPDQEP